MRNRHVPALEDQEVYDILEYQTQKLMDDVFLEQFPTLVKTLQNQGVEIRFAVEDGSDIEDEVVLPSGQHYLFRWQLSPVVEQWPQRKPHVKVEQHYYEDYIREYGPTSIATFAATFDVHVSTARRHLDGLMFQGKLDIERKSPWEESIYSLPKGHNT